MIEHILLVKYGEIYLKGQNRPFFLNLLLRRVRDAIRLFGARATLRDSRIYVTQFKDPKACAERISRIFGVHAVCPAIKMPKDDFKAVCDTACEMMRDVSGSFKVFARRSDKLYPMDSPSICIEMGGYILENCPKLSVDVHHPEHLLQVEIRDEAYLYADEIPAVGGMPVGSNGKALLLLSGGIDSPVAGYTIAKRGVEVSAIHFYSFPYTGERAKEKVLSLAKVLSEYCCGLNLYFVPFTPIQEAIHQKCPDEYTTLIMRRYMMRIADKLAEREQIHALITGESIGQVASQTMEALVCTDAIPTRPVFRPLVGMDKLEIIRLAEKIGSYDLSCLPYEDCCTVFTPRHPVTHPRIDKVCLAEEMIEDGDQLMLEALNKVEKLHIDAFTEY